MHFHFSFYSSILLIFFTQGLVFSFLLLRRGIQEDYASSKWLSLFLLLCSLYISPWMLGHAGWYSLQPYQDILFYLPLQQLFLIGPVMFFYVQSLLNPAFHFGRKEWLHFLPAILYGGYSLVVFIVDKIILHAHFFYANGRDKDLDPWYQRAGLISMVIYALLSIRYYNLYKKLIFNALSFAESVRFEWVRRFLLTFVLMQILRGIFEFTYPNWGNFPQKWWYYFFFSLLFYYMAFSGYANTIVSTLSFRVAWLDQKPVFVLEQTPIQSNDFAREDQALDLNEDNPVVKDLAQLQVWKEPIFELIRQEHLYENPKLALTDIATRLQTHPTLISRAVNHCFEMNFNDLINQFRVEAVKEKIAQGVHKQHTLLSIAYDCGFNSKSTFNRAFKKSTGLAPKNYVEKQVVV